MLRTLGTLSLVVALAASLISFDIPKGWFEAGSEPNSYNMGTVTDATRGGKKVATIQSTKNKIKGFGTLMQDSKPGDYLGKRVKMTGYLKTSEVEGWTGFWLRVDEKGSNKPLSFDNMANRRIKGNTEWQQYEIILDVPEKASNIAFGVLLVGTGQVWFDDITFEVVDTLAKTTGNSAGQHDSPMNLSFEQ